jgi:hypothetical protein
MKTNANQKRSLAMQKIWRNERKKMMQNRNKQKQSANIKKHYAEHPEHRTAISYAQKQKWAKIRRALQYCDSLGIDLEFD